jgi:hypothetical protein
MMCRLLVNRRRTVYCLWSRLMCSLHRHATTLNVATLVGGRTNNVFSPTGLSLLILATASTQTVTQTLILWRLSELLLWCSLSPPFGSSSSGLVRSSSWVVVGTPSASTTVAAPSPRWVAAWHAVVVVFAGQNWLSQTCATVRPSTRLDIRRSSAWFCSAIVCDSCTSWRRVLSTGSLTFAGT